MDRHSDGPPEENTDGDIFSRPRNPCEISNDRNNPPTNPLATCGVKTYACDDSLESYPSVQVFFNYDVYAMNETSREELLPFVEEIIFRSSAEKLGVDTCKMIYGQKRLRRRLSELPEVEPGAVGLGTDPKDLVRQDDPCVSTPDDVGLPYTECTPVWGGMTVYGDDLDILETKLLSSVKESMELDELVDSIIQKIIFLGPPEIITLPPSQTNPSPMPLSSMPTTAPLPLPVPLPAPVPAPPAPADSGVPDSNTEGRSRESSGLMLGLVVGAGSLIILIALLGVARRKRPKKEHAPGARSVQILDDYSFDVTDNLDTSALAHKDSLALVPQHFLPHHGIMMVDEDPSDGWAPAFRDGESPINTDAMEEIEEFKSRDHVSYDDSGSNPDGTSSAIGVALSLIEETEEDHPEGLDFGDMASTTSFDTRSSARRVLQMT